MTATGESPNPTQTTDQSVSELLKQLSEQTSTLVHQALDSPKPSWP
jgi:hypothetical protein